MEFNLMENVCWIWEGVEEGAGNGDSVIGLEMVEVEEVEVEEESVAILLWYQLRIGIVNQ